MNTQTIKKLQKQYGYDEMQSLIESGNCWHLEGSIGRAAMGALEAGACFLPDSRKRGAYGNTIPSRDDLKPGTKGTLGNSVSFWEKVESGEIFLDEEQEHIVDWL